MLLAVEGGGFFSSSATGYSKGLSLLLLGQKNEERPMRVLPWNQYQLVDQEVDSDLQLALRKKQAPPRGCTSFLCFGQASPELDRGPSPPIASPETSTISSLASENSNIGANVSVDGDETRICRKSSLKKHLRECSVMIGVPENSCNSPEDVQDGEVCGAERRKVHWTDACGRELAEVREFEVSEGHDSDAEFDDDGDRRCQCVIQ